jgi:hypothetical protein
MFPVKADDLVVSVISTVGELHAGRTIKDDIRQRNRQKVDMRAEGFENMHVLSAKAE